MGYSYATYEVYFYVNSNVNPPIPRGHQALTYDRPEDQLARMENLKTGKVVVIPKMPGARNWTQVTYIFSV